MKKILLTIIMLGIGSINATTISFANPTEKTRKITIYNEDMLGKTSKLENLIVFRNCKSHPVFSKTGRIPYIEYDKTRINVQNGKWLKDTQFVGTIDITTGKPISPKNSKKICGHLIKN